MLDLRGFIDEYIVLIETISLLSAVENEHGKGEKMLN